MVGHLGGSLYLHLTTRAGDPGYGMARRSFREPRPCRLYDSCIRSSTMAAALHSVVVARRVCAFAVGWSSYSPKRRLMYSSRGRGGLYDCPQERVSESVTLCLIVHGACNCGDGCDECRVLVWPCKRVVRLRRAPASAI